jgi:dolichol-phosphate mannosyltransferase
MRFVRFNAVGLLGFAVQLGVLALLVRSGLHYLAATALAVETAILHNFFWHERWTWADRPVHGTTRLARLARFHGVNGVVSLTGNLLLMPLLVGLVDLPLLFANAIAVLVCALVNFTGADRLVFSRRMKPPDYGEEASRCVY